MDQEAGYRLKHAKSHHRNIYAAFHCGYSVDELARNYAVDVIVIEDIIRRKINLMRGKR